MISNAIQAGVPAGWVTGDEVYGTDPRLRTELEYHRLGYVIAIVRDHRITTGGSRTRVDTLTATLPLGGSPGGAASPILISSDGPSTMDA